MMINVKVEEARKSRPADHHSLNAFHSFMERHNKSYTNRWQRVTTHHLRYHDDGGQGGVQAPISDISQEYAKGETATGDRAGEI